MITNITEHLKISEITCKCGCGFADLSPDIAMVFEIVRAYFDVPISVLSGCRCYAHNLTVSKAKDSRHVKGDALDLACPKGVDYEEFYAFLENLIGDRGGVGYYPKQNFVHIDLRGVRKRWSGKT